MIIGFYLCVSLLILAAAIYDLIYRAIPVLLLVVLTVVSFLGPLFLNIPIPPMESFWGGLAVGGLVLFIYLVTARKGIGEADIFLGAVIGFLFGWMKGLLVFSMANFLGLLVMIPMIMILGKKRTKLIPLGFFMAMAIFLEWGIHYTDAILIFLGL